MLHIIVALCAGISVACAGDVLVLTDSNFESRLAVTDLALVKFYAPWLVFHAFAVFMHVLLFSQVK